MKTFAALLVACVVVAACTDHETLIEPSAPAKPIAVATRPEDPSGAGRDAGQPSAARSAPSLGDTASPAESTAAGDEADALSAVAREATADGGETVDGLVARGDSALALHHPAEALADYERALAANPADGWSLVRATDALTALGQSEEARDRLRAFAAQHPDAIPDVFDALGWLELDLHDQARAKAAFRKALDASKDADADAWYGLAVIAADDENAKQVAEALRRVFELEPQRRAEALTDEAFEAVHPSAEWVQLFAPTK